MTAEFAEFWEPVRFAERQRVRIRLSAECRLTGPQGSPAGDLGHVGHHLEEDGRAGTVVDRWLPNPHAEAQGHRYRVRRDGPPIDGYRAGLYAACELILLDEATDGAGGGDKPVNGIKITLCETCHGEGCSACFETGRASTGRRCQCGDAESLHHRGECIAVKGPGWGFCPCEQFVEAKAAS